MKRINAILFSVLLLLFLSPLPSFAYSAQAYCVMEAESGDTVLSHCEKERLPMASTTKIMTALLLLENLPRDLTVRIPAEACGKEGSGIYLVPGEEMTVNDLVHAILLNSANDAAAAGAILLSGSEERFAEQMNERAAEIGMTDTNFVNPHGLEQKNHYTTAHDLALLMREALSSPDFLEISGTYRTEIPFCGEPDGRLLLNHNKLLRSLPGCISGKTGYTRSAGRCLVSVCKREGVTMIAVTLNDPDDWNDHETLYEKAFSFYVSVCPAQENEWNFTIPVTGGSSEYVTVTNLRSFRKTLRRPADGSEPTITVRPILPLSVSAPVEEGEMLGSLVFLENGTPIGSVSLTAEGCVPQKEQNLSVWDRILLFLEKLLRTPLTL